MISSPYENAPVWPWVSSIILSPKPDHYLTSATFASDYIKKTKQLVDATVTYSSLDVNLIAKLQKKINKALKKVAVIQMKASEQS